MSGFLYAIRCGSHVKIGWSSDPVSRLGKVNTDNPLPCTLIGVRKGSEDDEKRAHASLAQWRVSGEWFDLEAEAVQEFCRSLPAPESRWSKLAEHGSSSPLIAYRARNELTLEGMAAKIGTSRGYLHDLERGRRKPSPRKALDIERITGLSRHDLLPEIFGARASS